MKWLISVIAISFIIVGLSAQESINTSGGEARGEAGSISYSVGQVFYSTYTSGSGYLTEGVQQPYLIEVVIGKEAIGIDLGMAAYPNPTKDFLLLSIDNEQILENGWYFFLYDNTGREIRNQVIVTNQTYIDFSKLKPSTYLLRVFKDKKETKTFKIIKN